MERWKSVSTEPPRPSLEATEERITSFRGYYFQAFGPNPDIMRLQTSLDAMNIEVASLRAELHTIRENRWDTNLIMTGLVGGVIFVAISFFAGLWILAVIGAGMCAMAVIHQSTMGSPNERDRGRISERNKV